jgi:hypothetical protein
MLMFSTRVVSDRLGLQERDNYLFWCAFTSSDHLSPLQVTAGRGRTFRAFVEMICNNWARFGAVEVVVVVVTVALKLIDDFKFCDCHVSHLVGLNIYVTEYNTIKSTAFARS